MHLNTGEKWVKGNGGQIRYAPSLHGGEAQTSDPVLKVGTSITHHFCPGRLQCLSRLQRGGYVALRGISSGLERWQPPLVGAPRPEP